MLPLVKGAWLADSLAGWVTFLSLLAIILFIVLGIRWIRQHMLWRLRNRLIVTYMFIGVIPVVLLIAMAFITIYLFAGQFASFVVTSEIDAHLRSMSSVNETLAGELAAEIQAGKDAEGRVARGVAKPETRMGTSRSMCLVPGKADRTVLGQL